jgi:hypothetical protein
MKQTIKLLKIISIGLFIAIFPIVSAIIAKFKFDKVKNIQKH